MRVLTLTFKWLSHKFICVHVIFYKCKYFRISVTGKWIRTGTVRARRAWKIQKSKNVWGNDLKTMLWLIHHLPVQCECISQHCMLFKSGSNQCYKWLPKEDNQTAGRTFTYSAVRVGGCWGARYNSSVLVMWQQWMEACSLWGGGCCRTVGLSRLCPEFKVCVCAGVCVSVC